MNWLQRRAYSVGRLTSAFVQVQCIKLDVLNRDRGTLAGGYQLAVSHLSHLEPVFVTLLVRRHIRWMSRIEFFQYRVPGLLMKAVGVFAVKRQGVPVHALKTAIAEIKRGGVVGLFPDGGVRHGTDAIIRGGSMKRGACLIGQHTGRPIVPVVVLGTDKLNRIGQWLPFRRGHVWVAFGEPITPCRHLPSHGPDRRAARADLAAQIEMAFRATYRCLLAKYDLKDSMFP